MKVRLVKERMLDAIDRVTLIRSYKVTNPVKKSGSYRFIYAKIPMFFLFKGQTNTGGNIIEIGPCINWTKYLLVIEWN